jgi:hypothetical protein
VNELLQACIQAEPVLADMERILNKRMPGKGELRLPALHAVRGAIANATRCNEQECCFFGHQRSPSCSCAREAA